MRDRRLIAVVASVGLLALACGGGLTGTDGSSDASDACPGVGETGRAEPVEVIASTPREDVPSALTNPVDDSFPEPLVPVSSIVSGGPPPDGIPPIDEPQVLDAGEVDFLCDDEAVLAIDVGGEARAYPVRIMTRHEIVNDTVGDTPMTVTYCPLCNSAVAFHRRVGGRVLDFGTSGALYQSALVMYDRQTESLWSHFSGQAIVGVLTGAELSTSTVQTVGWADWLEANPDGTVLAPASGSGFYGDNPYPGYENSSGPLSPAFLQEEVDDRMDLKQRVLGIRVGDAGLAVRHEDLAAAGVLPLDVDGSAVVAWHRPGTASSLDSGQVALGRDVGATGVFVPESADGTKLTFAVHPDGFEDDQTGSVWNILGRAVSGPLEGEALEGVEHVDTFWFSWASFEPDTEIFEP